MGSPDSHEANDLKDSDLDALYVHSRRELWVILSTWVIFMLWVVGYSYLRGFSPSASVQRIFGMPSWVFWGVALPWGVASVFTIWFCWFGMAEDALGEEQKSALDHPPAP